MISYAQNREDVVLARLIDIVPKGTYVDVGAGHPILENVTYALYLEGWRGINIEPMVREAQLLRELRPEDITVQVAVGATSGRVTLYEAPIQNRGATTSDESLVERYRLQGQEFRPFEVDVLPLSSIVADANLDELHVLKIDVEGMEAEVLAGAQLDVIRPWVLVIEATVPNSRRESARSWEERVLAAGYVLTLFDGLNRFYVRADLHDAQELLSIPANVFDDWVPVELDLCRSALKEAEHYADALKEQGEVATAFAETLERERGRAIEYAKSLEEQSRTAIEYAKSLEGERERLHMRMAHLEARAAAADALEARVAELESNQARGRRWTGKRAVSREP